MKYRIVFLAVFLLISACNKMQPNSTTPDNKDFGVEVIYGVDNRIDFYKLGDTHWKELANSTLALMNYRKLRLNSAGTHFDIAAPSYGLSYHLCKDEKFYEQPTAAFCSGFLIGPELVVTAGHCIRNEFNCETVRFVFDYHYQNRDDNPLQIAKDQVYLCNEVVHSQTNALTGADYAILRLDRPVTDRQPLLIRTQGKLAADEELTVIGYPSGLPGKWANDGFIRSNDKENYFVTTLDTYGGNSGSAVFNSQTRLVEGILVRGETDFVYDQEERCRRSNVCQESGCRGEDVVRIDRVLDHITPQDLQP